MLYDLFLLAFVWATRVMVIIIAITGIFNLWSKFLFDFLIVRALEWTNTYKQFIAWIYWRKEFRDYMLDIRNESLDFKKPEEEFIDDSDHIEGDPEPTATITLDGVDHDLSAPIEHKSDEEDKGSKSTAPYSLKAIPGGSIEPYPYDNMR